MVGVFVFVLQKVRAGRKFGLRYVLRGASRVAQLVKNLPAMLGTPVYSWARNVCWRRDRLPTPVLLGLLCGSAGKESACSVGNLGLIPGLGRFPGGEHGNPFHYSCLENPHGLQHGVTKSQT